MLLALLAVTFCIKMCLAVSGRSLKSPWPLVWLFGLALLWRGLAFGVALWSGNDISWVF